MKKTKGWSINIEGASKTKKKKDLLQEFDILDVFCEQNLLSESNKTRLNDIKEELNSIWLHEETKLGSVLEIVILWKVTVTRHISMWG
jgi:hypothetical protein